MTVHLHFGAGAMGDAKAGAGLLALLLKFGPALLALVGQIIKDATAGTTIGPAPTGVKPE